ncbi:mannitol dehydrogenase family protein [Aureimonas fodinaquatilis]|uniref:Mannitol dehydrogenase family protein n=1 Tax=Aureimonas fodinaquatilis TaxID=2565783 RepID=A0A5B0DWG6_9HYPH|nr:mannitol dehydrogenase family protein [Aureimonas fodinaquatilis]KAA0971104.1 mannitol dehydrogenase family protein [Aureimonas fodinaquatilis]
MSLRLSQAALSRLPEAISRPAYRPDDLQTGIVHLGVGAFHRAHQAVYTESILNSGDMRWGILGVSLRSPATRNALAPQDGLYTVAVRDASGETLQIVGSSTGLLVAQELPEAIIAAMATPDVRIVTLTVTEKGYCYLPATGALDEQHPDILHDLANPHAPVSAIGFLVEAASRRRAANLPPFSVVSCDNLPSNGKTVASVVRRFAELRDPELAAYIAESVSFPSTMVDRIVPATTDADRQHIQAQTGLTDEWPIFTEPFSQWVVEDSFVSGRPAWENAGVTFVSDVEPFELMKLRLLNGSHSTLAYLGYLAGHETVDAAMAAPGFEPLLASLMREAMPTLPPLPGFDLAVYCDQLLERFRNPALKHRTWQIAMDGSQKIPQRLLGTIRARIAHGQGYTCLALGVAAWMRYVSGVDEAGDFIDVRDPMLNEIRGRLQGAGSTDDIVAALLSLDAVFGTDLPVNAGFVSAVSQHLEQLQADGAAATVESFLRGAE